MDKIIDVLRMAVVNALIVVAALVVYDRCFAFKVTVMDVGGYVKYRQAMFMRNHRDPALPMEELKKEASAYSQETQRWIDETASGARPNEVILFKDVVVNSKKIPRLTLDDEADKYTDDLKKAVTGEKR